jgi:DNA primase large subunit
MSDLFSDELRRRFVKAETTLFKIRYETDDSTERESFLSTRDFNWIAVSFLYSLPTQRYMYTRWTKPKKNSIKSNFFLI